MKKTPFLCTTFLCFAKTLFSLPQDPSVAEGTAQIHHKNKKHMTVKTSDKTIINYKSFNIDAKEKVEFLQPSSSSCVLNRVVGGDPSKILGRIESNGSVFLVNPNGVYFGKGSRINVGALVVSTLNITDENFMQDRFSFSRYDKKRLTEIVNEGHLSASNEGSIVLMAPIIKNKGTIVASAGQVLLASAEHVTLSFHENKLLSFSVEGEIKDAILEHMGSIKAAQVSLMLPIAKKAIKEVVNHDGIEQGCVFVEQNGKIFLAPESSLEGQKLSLQGGEIDVKGKVIASSFDAKGGLIEMIGKDLSLQGATLDASGPSGGGSILIGGAYRGGSSLPYASTVSVDRASTLSANATSSGDGGLIVLWSQDITSFAGTCYAKGGLLGGNGGIFETSSLGDLFTEKAYVDTRSPLGKIGTWLLDPSSLVISLLGGSPPSDCSTSGNIAVATIEAQASTVTLCADTITQEVPISMAIPGAGLIFQAPSGSTGILLLQEDITTKGGQIDMSGMEVSLLNSLTLDTTNGASSGANILIGTLNANTTLPSLTMNAGSADVFISNAGQINPLGAIHITAAETSIGTIFTNSSPVTVIGPLLLQGEAIINTAASGSGADITLNSVDATSIGADSLILNAGSLGSISVGNIGSLTPINNFTLVNAAQAILQDISSFSGSISIDSLLTLAQPLTTFTISEGNGSSNIRLLSVEGTLPYTQSLTLTTGSRDSLVLGAIGLATPLNEISLSSNQRLTLGSIRSLNFDTQSKTGQTTTNGDILSSTVSIEAGSLVLKGKIETDALSLLTHGPITRSGSNQDLIISSAGTTYINALNGDLGTIDTPISLTTLNKSSPIILGAKDIASLSGPSYEIKLIEYDTNNPPCLLFFNDQLISACKKNAKLVFDLLPKRFFKAGYFNGKNLGIGTNFLTQLGPYFLSSYYTEDFVTRVENPTRIEFGDCGQVREYLDKNPTLPDEEATPLEEASKL